MLHLTPAEEVAEAQEAISQQLVEVNRLVERHNDLLRQAKAAKSEFGRNNAMSGVAGLKSSIAKGKEELARLRQIVADNTATT